MYPRTKNLGGELEELLWLPPVKNCEGASTSLLWTEQRQLFNNPAPTSPAGRIPWHQAAVSRSWIPTTSSATRSSIQVPEISSQSMEEDVEILEEPAPQSVNIQSSQAPTLPGDITSTSEGGNELTVIIPCTSVNMAEELMMLNNQYGAAAATIQEYINRMNAGDILGALWTGRSGMKLLAPTQRTQENSN